MIANEENRSIGPQPAIKAVFYTVFYSVKYSEYNEENTGETTEMNLLNFGSEIFFCSMSPLCCEIF